VVKGILPSAGASRSPTAQVVLRPLPTLAIGVLGGLMVGMTSVGSGSLMIVLLLVLYPGLPLAVLVGTDLVQAIPLVASAALGHLVFGDVKLGLTASLIIGSLPGVYLGARFSSRAPDRVIRPVLAVVLFISGLKLVGVPTITLGVAVVATAVVAALAWTLSPRLPRPRPWSPPAAEERRQGAAPTPAPPAP
jgi:uncharacterized membrane protein YfcA